MFSYLRSILHQSSLGKPPTLVTRINSRGKRSLLLALLFCSVPALANDLPNLGNPYQIQLSSGREAKLAQEFMARLEAAGIIFSDPIATEYLKSIGNKLVSHLPPTSQKNFHFFFASGSTINAFAGPQGYIGINTGLILATRNESELAAVLAHEIAHVTQGHLAEKLEQASTLRYSTVVGVLLAIALGTQSPQAGSGALAATLASAEQSILNFSRNQEKEADRLGMDILNRSGYAPRSMGDFFSRMKQEERYSEQLPELLSSHPLTEDRIADTQNRAAQYPDKAYPSPLAYYLIKNRIRLETASDPHAALQYFEKKSAGVKPYPEAAEYGYGLALLHAGRPQAAYPILAKLATDAPNNLLFQLALANAALNNKKHEEALGILAKLYELHPDNYVITLAYAKGLVQVNKPGDASQVLQKYLLAYPDGGKPYETLARAQAKSGHQADAYQTRAKYYLENRQPEKAIDQLKMALTIQSNDPDLVKRLNAKMVAIQRDVRESAKG